MNQARVYKELLDSLEIDKVIMLAVSAGGAPAIQFARKYPERAQSLIMVGSGSPSQEEIEGPTGPPNLVLNGVMFRIVLFKPFRGIMRSSLFGIEKETFKSASPEEKAALEKIFDTLLPVGPKKPGIINDKNITNVDMVENYDKYKLEDTDTCVSY